VLHVVIVDQGDYIGTVFLISHYIITSVIRHYLSATNDFNRY